MSNDQITLKPGMRVHDSAGDLLGTVSDTGPDYIVVGRGGFFQADHYIPVDALEGTTDEGDIYLAGTKEDALTRGWDRVPGGRVDAAADAEAIRVPVYAEDITAVKREVDRGAVRIEKDVVTEDRTISVPVTEERVRVTRVETSGDAPVGADAFQEGVIEVPVRGQEVEVDKTARKAGEVIVEKEAETRTEQVGGTVRREEVRVEDETVGVDRLDDTRR